MREYEVRYRGQSYALSARTASRESAARIAPTVLGFEEELPALVEIRAVGERFHDRYRVWIDRRGGLRVEAAGGYQG